MHLVGCLIRSQMNPFYTLISCFFKTHLNVPPPPLDFVFEG